VAQLGKGIEALQALSPSRERSRLELELQATLGSALASRGGWGMAETGRAFARARELGRELGETAQLLPVLWGLAVYHVDRAELPAAWEAAGELMRFVEEEKSGETASLMAAYRASGTVHYHLGELEQARHCFERVLSLYHEAQHRRLAVAYMTDFRVAALSFLANLYFFLGYPDQAQTACAESLAHARGTAHPSSLLLALLWACYLASVVPDAEATLAYAEDSVALCAEHNFANKLTEAAGHMACARARLGVEDAVAAATQGPSAPTGRRDRSG
jgi:tetratricopeptide (TPR) repeat protein